MFGLLRDVHFAVFCGTAVNGVWVPVCHIAPFPGGVKMAVSPCSSQSFGRNLAYGVDAATAVFHAVADQFLVNVEPYLIHNLH
jgi:hypothetical protein